MINHNIPAPVIINKSAITAMTGTLFFAVLFDTCVACTLSGLFDELEPSVTANFSNVALSDVK
jgi:hypothetical protein